MTSVFSDFAIYILAQFVYEVYCSPHASFVNCIQNLVLCRKISSRLSLLDCDYDIMYCDIHVVEDNKFIVEANNITFCEKKTWCAVAMLQSCIALCISNTSAPYFKGVQ